MQIEIWSDLMCPFCFIGKHRFENALANFSKKEEVEITWKSFELYPEIVTDPNVDMDDFLAERKRVTKEQATQMLEGANQAANNVGITFNWEKVIIANTRKAHQMLHLAEKEGIQNELKELLFQAYFVDGKNIDDLDTLIDIGVQVKLNKNIIKHTLENNEFTEDVNNDINVSQQLGVTGVPFFVFNRKYAVSGAQSQEYFHQALETSFADWTNNETSGLEAQENQNSCAPGSGCC